MAEMVVSPVIDKLVDFIVEEAKLLKGVHREVEDLKDELESIQCFLKDADARAERRDESDSVRNWVKQVREVAFRIEDVIDEYMFRVADRRHRRGFIGFVRKIGRLVKKFKMRYELTSQIQEIKSTVLGIKERSERYCFRSSEQGSSSNVEDSAWHDRQGHSLFINEEEVVGIDSARDKLIDWLVKGASRRTVISVVGMGGIGKTTLARKVYDKQTVTTHFECHAWITVSQSYTMEELLKSLIKEFCQAKNEAAPEGIDTMEKVSLIRTTREYLQRKRYVVVFDDVWKIDFWRDIELALLDNDKGSRIMVTTRNMDVADFCKKSSLVHVHELQPLPQEGAWQLFCRMAFSFEGHCLEELKELSLGILGKCKGLPLAIVAIGGLLSTKNKVVYEWQKLYDSLGSELESNPHLTSVKTILLLSYHDLPYHLKSCFLWFSIFPEDYFVVEKRLFRVWTSEGFVKEKRGKTLEEVAKGYLNELIHRNLVQRRIDDSGERMYHVHDLMREIIQSRSRELNFCQVIEEEGSNFNSKSRRLSICNSSVVNILENNIVSSGLRSIYLFKVKELPESFVGTLFHNFKLLKVLDFEGAPLDYLDEKVGNFSHLRYLNVRNTKIKMLPKSIGMLCYLQTLNLGNTLVRELPIEINKLYKLQHLVAYFYDREINVSLVTLQGVRIHDGIGCLANLETLQVVEANHGVNLIKEMRKLRQLRSLAISNLRGENGKDLCASIEMMNHLEDLDVTSISEENEILDLESISSPPQFIRELRLKGPLEKLPHWIPKLQNLVKLSLYFSRLTDDPLKALHALPNLAELYLFETYDGEQLHMEEGGFQKLKWLALRNLKGLKRLVIDKGGLPLLEKLEIGASPQLKEVPSDIHHLRSLQTLKLIDMLRDFALGVQPDQGPDYWVVQHIPNVQFWYRLKGQTYKTYMLGDSKLLERLQM